MFSRRRSRKCCKRRVLTTHIGASVSGDDYHDRANTNSYSSSNVSHKTEPALFGFPKVSSNVTTHKSQQSPVVPVQYWQRTFWLNAWTKNWFVVVYWQHIMWQTVTLLEVYQQQWRAKFFCCFETRGFELPPVACTAARRNALRVHTASQLPTMVTILVLSRIEKGAPMLTVTVRTRLLLHVRLLLFQNKVQKRVFRRKLPLEWSWWACGRRLSGLERISIYCQKAVKFEFQCWKSTDICTFLKDHPPKLLTK